MKSKQMFILPMIIVAFLFLLALAANSLHPTRYIKCDTNKLTVEKAHLEDGEAVIEKMEIKKDLFKTLDEICKEDCIFGTNTSSLSVTEIANGIKHNVIGMHFFNPADRMKLVEVISGENTPVETKEAIIEYSKSLGKTPVEVAEGPGFVVNRILIPMINEACFIYQEGLASVEDIDTAMKLGANHPMGPLALGDLIGLDIVLDVMEVLYTETGDPKYRPCTLLKKMVRAGKLGQKTKQGFYSYN